MTVKSWRKHLMKTYEEMKQDNPNIKLKDAMKVAKRTYRREEE